MHPEDYEVYLPHITNNPIWINIKHSKKVVRRGTIYISGRI